MTFEFAAPQRILFGEGRIRELGGIAAELGSRALLVEGAGGRGEPALELLRERGVPTHVLRVVGEPTTTRVEAGVEEARREGCDLVVAVGGGSVIDAGKAIAALLTNPGGLLEYLEVVGKGRPLDAPSAPLVAVPTTAGTGAEATRNAVLTVEGERVKVSLRSAWMLPTVALIDPELTYSLPPALTATTGMDALTQCIEPLVSPRATPLTDALAREGVRRAAGALRRAFEHGDDAEARRDMAVASLCGGLALANAKLGAVHGFAGPLGGMFPIPHGAACARLLAPVAEANVRALRSRAPSSPALRRYQEIAALVTGRSDAAAEDAAVWLSALVEDLAVPRLSAFGVGEAHIEEVVEKALASSSMVGNPVVLSDRELRAAFRAAV